MKTENTPVTERDNAHFYQCDSPRIAVLTKMVLDRHGISYQKKTISTKSQFIERYYVDATGDNHWLENRMMMMMEIEIEKDPVLKARFDHQVAVKQIYFEQR